MIARNLHGLKVEKSSRNLTSYAGLPMLTELAHQSGLIRDLDSIPGIWQRHGDYTTSDYVMGLALTLIAGGEGLDDMRLLSHDAGLRQMALYDVPASNSAGEFLRRLKQRTLYLLGQVNSKQVGRFIERRSFKRLTLDIDSTLIESQKKEAAMTYNGFEGYNPVLAWLAEANLFLAEIFRPGNISPQSHVLSLLKHCLKVLPAGIELWFRSDSAGYQWAVMQECVDRNVPFAICADLNVAVKEVIEQIPDEKWRLVVRGSDLFLLAETVYAPGCGHSGEKLPAFRLVVTQRLTGQLELFKSHIKYHAIISSLPESMNSEQVLDFYNGRGSMEKAIGELKNGFGLDKLPCGQLLANAGFLQIAMLAYNLVEIFKQEALPEGWKRFCVKNLRFRLLCQAGIVVRHAGSMALKLSRAFPFFEIFEKARWAVLSPALAT